ncbi:MAG: serine kinase [Spirochaetota bacterium]
MKLREIVTKLNLSVRTGEDFLDVDVKRGYASDLMSDVIANTRENDLWITLQGHVNTIAIAAMKDLAGLVLINSRQPEAETAAKAEKEHIPILISDLPAFELIGKLYALGITGI